MNQRKLDDLDFYEKYLLNQTKFDLTIPAERRVQAKLAVKDGLSE